MQPDDRQNSQNWEPRRQHRAEKIRAKKSGNAFARGIKDFDSTSYGILMKTLAVFPRQLILSGRRKLPRKYINVHRDYSLLFQTMKILFKKQICSVFVSI